MSARVELKKAGCCSWGIDKVKPAMLDTTLSNKEWLAFCKDMDRVLAPLNKCGPTSVLLVVAVTAGIGVYAAGIVRLWAAWIALGPLIISLIILSFYLQCEMKRLHPICERHSRTDVTFHLRHDSFLNGQTCYVEIMVGTIPTPTTAASSLEEVKICDNQPALQPASRLADRLQQLEEARQYLSPEEYSHKKAHMLEST